jgi:hypothetical protein
MAEAGKFRCGGHGEERKLTMRAQVGDLLIADGADSHRACEIIRLSHADGSPPYVGQLAQRRPYRPDVPRAICEACPAGWREGTPRQALRQAEATT